MAKGLINEQCEHLGDKKVKNHTRWFYNHAIWKPMSESHRKDKTLYNDLEWSQKFLQSICECKEKELLSLNGKPHGQGLWPATKHLVYPQDNDEIRPILTQQHETKVYNYQNGKLAESSTPRKVAKTSKAESHRRTPDSDLEEGDLDSLFGEPRSSTVVHPRSTTDNPKEGQYRRLRSTENNPINTYLNYLYTEQKASCPLTQAQIDQDTVSLQFDLTAKIRSLLRLSQENEELIAGKCQELIRTRTLKWVNEGFLQQSTWDGKLFFYQTAPFARKLVYHQKKWRREETLAVCDKITETLSDQGTNEGMVSSSLPLSGRVGLGEGSGSGSKHGPGPSLTSNISKKRKIGTSASSQSSDYTVEDFMVYPDSDGSYSEERDGNSSVQEITSAAHHQERESLAPAPLPTSPRPRIKLITKARNEIDMNLQTPNPSRTMEPASPISLDGHVVNQEVSSVPKEGVVTSILNHSNNQQGSTQEAFVLGDATRVISFTAVNNTNHRQVSGITKQPTQGSFPKPSAQSLPSPKQPPIQKQPAQEQHTPKQPVQKQSIPTQPALTQLIQKQSAPGQPVPTQPSPTQPIQKQPTPAQPAPTQPAKGQSACGQPGPSQTTQTKSTPPSLPKLPSAAQQKPTIQILLRLHQSEYKYSDPYDRTELFSRKNSEFFTFYAEKSGIPDEKLQQLSFSFPDAVESIRARCLNRGDESAWTGLTQKIKKLIKEVKIKKRDLAEFEIRVEAVGWDWGEEVDDLDDI